MKDPKRRNKLFLILGFKHNLWYLAVTSCVGRCRNQGQIIGMALGVAGGLISQVKSPAGRIVGALDAKADQEEAA